MEEHIVGYLKGDKQRRYVDSRRIGEFDGRKIQGRTVHREEKGGRCEQEDAGWHYVVVQCNPHHRIAYGFKYRCRNYER